MEPDLRVRLRPFWAANPGVALMLRRVRVVIVGAISVFVVAWVMLAGDGGRLTKEETVDVLSEIGGGHVLAYSSADGVTLVEFSTGAVQTVPQHADELAVLGPYVLLYQSGRTLGFDSTDPSQVQVLFTGGRLVSTPTVDVYAFLDSPLRAGEPNQVFLGRLDSGFIGERLTIPADASVLPVQGLGVLVTPVEGGTLRPVIDGFEQVAEGTVISASANGWIEVRCSPGSDAECDTLFVDLTAEETTPIPSAVAAARTVVVSPDAQWVLYADDDAATLLEPATGRSVEIDTQIDPSAVWSPDSSYVAWVDDDSDAPVLHVVSAPTGEVVDIDLSVLGATSRASPAVTIL